MMEISEQNTDATESVPVKEQSKYALDSVFKITLLIALSIFICVLLLFIYVLFNPLRNPKTVYFPSTPDFRLIQDTALDQPNLPTNILLNWVTSGIMMAHTFNFVDYQTVLDNAKIFFTKEGYDSYIAALTNNKILEQTITNKYVVRTVPTEAPQITDEKPLAGYYLWSIRVPVLIRYRNVDTDRYDNATIDLLVMRVPVKQAPYGVQIFKYGLSLEGKSTGF